LGTTFIFTVSNPQLDDTIYVVLTIGEAVTTGPVLGDNVLAGVHVKADAFVALSVALLP
jgi:hypothetical protein